MRLAWSGPPGDSLLHQVSFILQASLGLSCADGAGGREQEEPHRPLAAGLGTDTLSSPWATLRCMTELRVRRGKDTPLLLWKALQNFVAKGKVQKRGAIKAISHIEQAAFEPQAGVLRASSGCSTSPF